MKKKITVDGFACDGCCKEVSYAAECRNCHKTFCSACVDKEAREYTNLGKRFYYCLKCDSALTQNCKDETHYLLRLINKTLKTREQQYDDFTAELNRFSKRLEMELLKPKGDL